MGLEDTLNVEINYESLDKFDYKAYKEENNLGKEDTLIILYSPADSLTFSKKKELFDRVRKGYEQLNEFFGLIPLEQIKIGFFLDDDGKKFKKKRYGVETNRVMGYMIPGKIPEEDNIVIFYDDDETIKHELLHQLHFNYNRHARDLYVGLETFGSYSFPLLELKAQNLKKLGEDEDKLKEEIKKELNDLSRRRSLDLTIEALTYGFEKYEKAIKENSENSALQLVRVEIDALVSKENEYEEVYAQINKRMNWAGKKDFLQKSDSETANAIYIMAKEGDKNKIEQIKKSLNEKNEMVLEYTHSFLRRVLAKKDCDIPVVMETKRKEIDGYVNVNVILDFFYELADQKNARRQLNELFHYEPLNLARHIYSYNVEEYDVKDKINLKVYNASIKERVVLNK